MQVDEGDVPPGGTGFGGDKVDWAFYDERSGNCTSALFFLPSFLMFALSRRSEYENR
jgi:hypothetical protein